MKKTVTRKVFLDTVLGFAAGLATKGRALLAKPFQPQGRQNQQQGPGAIQSAVLENDNHRLEFDQNSGQPYSFRAVAAPNQEFLARNDDDPVFEIQYLDEENRFRQLASTAAARIVPTAESNHALVWNFYEIGGFALDATVEVRMPADEPSSRWSISINNKAGLRITDVQFPFVVVSYRLGGEEGSEALLLPSWYGRLLKAPQPQNLEPDSPHAWQCRPENQDSHHYPGLTHAQLLAYYNDRAGIYVSSQDSSGAIKWIKPVHRKNGIRLGFSHVGDWPQDGERRLGYDIVLQAFSGDWYSAAEVYRQWALEQPWAQAPLHQRSDIPAWLLDSPAHIMIRMQGELDEGPADSNPEFLPYRKLIPLLDEISTRTDAAVTPVIMAWERNGPWVYPDCFPPAGGDESVSTFAELARKRGWHVGSFANGTRWVTQQFWSGYQGEEYFRQQGGERTVCQTHEGRLWREEWDKHWRPSYACCLGVLRTREIAFDFVQRLMRYGLDWIQFLDQNVGCSTFPCYAADHSHPAAPGKWMTTAMRSLLEGFQQLAREAKEKDSGRNIVFSVEFPPSEYFIPYFTLCDVRVTPPGHDAHSLGLVPLYHFLYHEFILMHGGFGFGPEPYHLPTKTACNLVLGQMLGGVLTGSGRLLNKDTINWAPWEPPVESHGDGLAMLRRAIALRRGRARDFLVYGRMQSPAEVRGIQTVRWTHDRRQHEIPAVFHAAWRSPKGAFGIVLANWTNEQQEVVVEDTRLPAGLLVSVSGGQVRSEARRAEGPLELRLPALSCALIEPA